MEDRHVEMIAEAIRRIAFGDITGPCGLEALAMAINGKHGAGENNLSSAISEAGIQITDAIGEAAMLIATAIKGD